MIPNANQSTIVTEKTDRSKIVGKTNTINLGVTAGNDSHQVKKYQDEPGQPGIKINTSKINAYLQNKYGW